MAAALGFPNRFTPALLKSLDLLWQYREGIAVLIGLLLLVIIVDNLVAIHRELEHLRITLDALAKGRGRTPGIETQDLADSEGWRAD